MPENLECNWRGPVAGKERKAEYWKKLKVTKAVLVRIVLLDYNKLAG